MGVQTSYNYGTPRGVAGGLHDISVYEINTRLNKEPGTLLFGMGVVQGDKPGSDVRLPSDSSTAEEFEGVAMNGFTTQQDLEGSVKIRPNQSVGILSYGKAWIRIGLKAAPAYGEDAYLIVSGEEKGFFTTYRDDSVKVKVPARFIGGKDGNGAIAPARFFNQGPDSPITPNPTPAG